MNASIFPPIPRETARAAQAVIGRSNFYLLTGDRIDLLFRGLDASPAADAGLGLSRNQAMLYLITIFQYVETLPDHKAPDALRERLDWKYALHLPLNYAHLNALALCETRQQLHMNPLKMQYFQALISRLAAMTMLADNRLQTVAAVRLINRVCLISRVAKTWEAINQALESLAIRQPEWLLDNNQPHWFERYDPIHKSINLYESDPELVEHAQMIGQDGDHLLKAIEASGLAGINEIPEIVHMKTVWQEQFSLLHGNLVWRKATCSGCVLSASLRTDTPM